jgi:hypothetical protein
MPIHGEEAQVSRKYIRIVAVPPGEAPEEIRRKWVGVRIPLPLFHKHAKDWRAAGVLTGPRTLFARLSTLWAGDFRRESGYAVSVIEALAALEAADPAAARWWRENAPHLIRPSKAFVFAAEVCVVEDGPAVT